MLIYYTIYATSPGCPGETAVDGPSYQTPCTQTVHSGQWDHSYTQLLSLQCPSLPGCCSHSKGRNACCTSSLTASEPQPVMTCACCAHGSTSVNRPGLNFIILVNLCPLVRWLPPIHLEHLNKRIPNCDTPVNNGFSRWYAKSFQVARNLLY
jgi:hypothetical protein